MFLATKFESLTNIAQKNIKIMNGMSTSTNVDTAMLEIMSKIFVNVTCKTITGKLTIVNKSGKEFTKTVTRKKTKYLLNDKYKYIHYLE